jgi:hypothetical protein
MRQAQFGLKKKKKKKMASRIFLSKNEDFLVLRSQKLYKASMLWEEE